MNVWPASPETACDECSGDGLAAFSTSGTGPPSVLCEPCTRALAHALLAELQEEERRVRRRAAGEEGGSP